MAVYAPWQQPRVPTEGPGSVYEPDPGTRDTDPGPTDLQMAKNREREARIAALRANPMFKKSSTPIQFKEGANPMMANMMLGLMNQGDNLRGNAALGPMFKPTVFRPR